MRKALERVLFYIFLQITLKSLCHCAIIIVSFTDKGTKPEKMRNPDRENGGKTNEEQGVLLENENGKLMISKETLENLVNSVALNFEGTEQVTTRVELDRENNVMVYVNLMVSSNVIIKELSANLQTKIKEKIKTATDLDVKEVNITVKKVAPKEEQQEA